MPRGKRGSGSGGCASRASASFSENEVDAMLQLLARLDTHHGLVPPLAKVTLNGVRHRFINMRGSITAAQAAKRAQKAEAAQ